MPVHDVEVQYITLRVQMRRELVLPLCGSKALKHSVRDTAQEGIVKRLYNKNFRHAVNCFENRDKRLVGMLIPKMGSMYEHSDELDVSVARE